MSVDAVMVTSVEVYYQNIKIILRMWLDETRFHWTYELQGRITGFGGRYVDSGTAAKSAIANIDRIMDRAEYWRSLNVFS